MLFTRPLQVSYNKASRMQCFAIPKIVLILFVCSHKRWGDFEMFHSFPTIIYISWFVEFISLIIIYTSLLSSHTKREDHMYSLNSDIHLYQYIPVSTASYTLNSNLSLVSFHRFWLTSKCCIFIHTKHLIDHYCLNNSKICITCGFKLRWERTYNIQ